MKLEAIQNDLCNEKWDGWLIYDFRRTNDCGCALLGIPSHALLTRRFFYWIPKEGDPVKIVHSIERHIFENLPGVEKEYQTYQELHAALEETLTGASVVAMEYSPMGQIPYFSKVDAGTFEMIRSFGIEVVSSADLLQLYGSVMSDDQIEDHLYAARVVDDTIELAFRLIGEKLISGQTITEYAVQQFILEEFAKRGCVADDEPLCAVNAHSANPHYCPSAKSFSEIREGDFVMIDLSCKRKTEGAIYADITRMACAASKPTERQREIFSHVYHARETALRLVESRFENNEPIMGWEVDKASREVIEKAGFGNYFTHRTGHNLGQHIHGNGTHMDNFETKDTRKILPRTCFTIEPGIYLPNEFGVRLECDVLITEESSVKVTCGMQDSIRCLLS